MEKMHFLSDKRVTTGLVIAFLLGIPLAITFGLRSGKNHYQYLPFYGPVKVAEKGDTVHHRLPDFKFQTHQGDSLSFESELDGKNLVLHFFSTGCPGHCPEIFRKLKSLGSEYQNLEDLRILSITIEPESDQKSDLKAFAERMNIWNDQWLLSRSTTSATQELLDDGFHFRNSLDSSQLRGLEKKVTARNALFLIDKQKRIRGVYEGSSRQGFKNLKGEIRVLFVNQNLGYAKGQ